MSKESVDAFWQRLEDDPSLLAKLSEISSDDGNALVSIAQEVGITLDADDLKGWSSSGKDDLSDEELESASGGKCCCCSSSAAININ